MDKRLVGPGGETLHREPQFIVIKSSRNLQLPQQVIQGIAQVSQMSVIELPLSSELMMGDLAAREIDSAHTAIHAIIEEPAVNFSGSDIKLLHKAMCFLCEQTGPKDGSAEVKLMKELKKMVDNDNK